MHVIEPSRYVAAVRTESDALARAAEGAALDAPVPTCPGWTVTDLLDHCATTQTWALANVTSAAGERVRIREVARRTPDVSPVEWFRARAGELVAALDAADPDRSAWTWAGDDIGAAWWFRRMAHEVAVHRFDAEVAAGAAGSPVVDPALAVDGVDELLGVFGPRGYGDDPWGRGQTVHLHCTDSEGEWLVRIDADALVIEHVHAKGDVAARGSASDLMLTGWGRLDGSSLEVFGDPALLERFFSTARV